MPGPRHVRRAAVDSFQVFGRVNVGQTVAIVASVMLLGRFDQWVYVPAAVCLVVGAHFLPLARTFAQPQYWWTGGLLMALAPVGAVALGGDGANGRVLLGFGAALVLWTTALHVARKG
ncbi:hypothetical protein HZS56_35915 [Streptomyces sp. A108]|nr:hypothetical protein [Streptomyces sp. A108]